MYPGETKTIERDGFKFRVKCEYDEDTIAPWEDECGHGPVSDWERREKRPGELILCSDRSSHRFYDFAEAIKIAKRDGWDVPPYRTGTKSQQAERAAKSDYEHLRAFCENRWCYVGIVVELLDENDNAVEDASLWHVDSGLPRSDKYHEDDIIPDLIADVLAQAKDSLPKQIAKLQTLTDKLS